MFLLGAIALFLVKLHHVAASPKLRKRVVGPVITELPDLDVGQELLNSRLGCSHSA
jgi:hypothetical protein